jgi:hypothetical protein
LLLSAACAPKANISLSAGEICSRQILSLALVFSNTKPAGESVSVVSIDKFEIDETPADCTAETIHFFALEMSMTNDDDSQYFYIA